MNYKTCQYTTSTQRDWTQEDLELLKEWLLRGSDTTEQIKKQINNLAKTTE